MPSWVESANAPDCNFPIQNLPFGVFSHGSDRPRCASAIGDQVVDLAALEAAGLVDAGGGAPVFAAPALNAFMALGPDAWARVRGQLTALFDGSDDRLQKDSALQAKVLVPMAAAQMHLPFTVASFTDFYAGRHHATNVGTMFRGPENALPPNWLHIPIGYNGRASTVVVSGTPIRRPLGQTKPPNAETPGFGPGFRAGNGGGRRPAQHHGPANHRGRGRSDDFWLCAAE